MENESVIQETLFNYIKKNTFAKVSGLNAQTMIFREGILDSMAFVLLIDFIQEHFNIKPSDSDLVEENFESVEAMTKYIRHKQKEESLA